MKSSRPQTSKCSRLAEEPHHDDVSPDPIIPSTSTRLSFLESPSIIIQTTSRTLSDFSEPRETSRRSSQRQLSSSAKTDRKSRSAKSRRDTITSARSKICHDPFGGVSYILTVLEPKEETSSSTRSTRKNPSPSKSSATSSMIFPQPIKSTDFLKTEQLCYECSEPIKYPQQRRSKFNNRFYHSTCFVCARCRKPISGTQSSRFTVTKDGRPRCAQCDIDVAKICFICDKAIVNTKTIVFQTNPFHSDCFRCDQCDMELVGQKDVYSHDMKPYCSTCHTEFFAPHCSQCEQPILDSTYVTFKLGNYHRRCFFCIKCRQVIHTEQKFYNTQDGFICNMCEVMTL